MRDRDAGQEAKSALAIRGEVSTIAQHGTPADNKGTRLDWGQIPIHTPLRLVLGIIICNSDNKLLEMVPNTRHFIILY